MNKQMEEERQYEKLRKLGKELHIPTFEAFLELEVRDKDGKVIHHHRQRSHSWVRNAYNLLFTTMAAVAAEAATNLKVVMTSGADRESSILAIAVGDTTTSGVSIIVGSAYFAAAGIDTMGIVVGTGVGAEDFEGYALGTKIASGSAPTQLDYTVTTAPAISTVDTTKKTEWVRYFNNNSGGAITVNEVGIYVKGSLAADIYFMVCRDLVSGGVEIPDTGQLKVTYTIQLAYPA